MEQIKKIDVHAHAIIWKEYEPDYLEGGKKLTLEELFDIYYNKLNVEKCILLPGVSPECSTSPVSSSMMKYLSDTYPDKAAWFCNVDPRALTNTTDANLGFLLEYYKSIGARGIGELTVNMAIDSPMMQNLFGYAQELSLPVTIHVAPELGGYYGVYDDLGLPRLEKILKAFPKLKIFGHSQCFWSEISENSDELRFTYPEGKVTEGRIHTLMRKYENLYCDLSAGSGANAMMRDREHAARFFEEFSDRILYGCDICMDSHSFPFEFDAFLTSMRETGEISEKNYRKIVRENAIRELNL